MNCEELKQFKINNYTAVVSLENVA